MSASVSGGCIRVMMEPGFRAGASAIQRARWLESLGKRPLAMVARLAMCVRFGPITPPETPWMVSQPMHAERPYTVLPCAARLRWGGVAAGPSWACAHAPNPESESTITRSRMLACDAPQNSAHWPEYALVESART